MSLVQHSDIVRQVIF